MEPVHSEGCRAAGERATPVLVLCLSSLISASSVITLVRECLLLLVVCIQDKDIMTSLVSRAHTHTGPTNRRTLCLPSELHVTTARSQDLAVGIAVEAFQSPRKGVEGLGGNSSSGVTDQNLLTPSQEGPDSERGRQSWKKQKRLRLGQ